MKNLLLIAFLVLCAGCDRKINASTEESLAESILETRATLSGQDLEKFDKFVEDVMYEHRKFLRNHDKENLNPVERAKNLSVIHDKTALEIVDLYLENENKKAESTLKEIHNGIRSQKKYITSLLAELADVNKKLVGIKTKISEISYVKVSHHECASHIVCDYLNIKILVENLSDDIIQNIKFFGIVSLPNKSIELDFYNKDFQISHEFLNFTPRLKLGLKPYASKIVEWPVQLPSNYDEVDVEKALSSFVGNAEIRVAEVDLIKSFHAEKIDKILHSVDHSVYENYSKSYPEVDDEAFRGAIFQEYDTKEINVYKYTTLNPLAVDVAIEDAKSALYFWEVRFAEHQKND